MKIKWYKDGEFNPVDLTDYFCPNCGKKSVYVEQWEGDYYSGPHHYCISCKFDFSLPSSRINDGLEIQVEI